jgi:hypothetical protein
MDVRSENPLSDRRCAFLVRGPAQPITAGVRYLDRGFRFVA